MNAIVAVDSSWAIGRDNDLLFSLPTDMKRFRTLTTGGTVIMGRKTLDSFPGGNPLPNRRNIVITHNSEFIREGAEVCCSPDEAMRLVKGTDPDKIWLIGGGSVYTAMLKRCKRVYLTRIEADATDPDTFFPNLDKLPGWEIESVSEPIVENGLTYRFIDYVNKNL